MLLRDVPFGGVDDLDPLYEINTQPAGEIHVLRFILSATTAAGEPSAVLPSRPINVLLSPDGESPMQRLHHASLYLERHMASVPEPSSLLALAALALGGSCRRPTRRV